MAETLLLFGFEKLWELLVRESDRFTGVNGQFTELKSELETLRGFLKDADAKKHTNQEIVYDAEDIIETFVIKEELGKTCDIKKRIKQIARNIADRREVAIDMEALSKRIAKVNRICRVLEYKRSLPMKGLDKNIEKLVGHLVEEDTSQVVSIIGMGGIGKTTLARQVFNHETVKSHFVGLAWVCISQQFTRRHVWQTILRKLRPKYNKSEMTEDELQENIFQVLETQKALIVLDDIWRDEDWDRIKPVFPREKGWKVLITSRNEGVALRADPKCFTFKPDFLTFQEGWTILRRIAFPRENTIEYKVDEKMEAMGKLMIKHCGGLPLAIKVLSGLLAAQCTLREWERIYENISAHIVGGTGFDDKSTSSVYHVLYQSFEELPIYLKHCFLYLAHFQEDSAINVGELSYKWDAEGIPRHRCYNEASIRDVAYGYIEELVKRNMVISERDTNTSRFETCKLHDMMREFCLLRAEEENFLQIYRGRSTAESKSPCRSRRLVIHLPDDHDIFYPMEMKNPKLRSLLFIRNQYEAYDAYEAYEAPRLVINWLEFQLMRVLDVSYNQFEGGKLHSSIGKLIHLRYLSLYMTNIAHLPSSMQNLKLLLYLNLNIDDHVYVPNIFKEMRELTFLCLPLKIIRDRRKLELGNLVKLETLENFSTEHGSVRDLQGMTQLRDLYIYIRGEGCSMEILSSSLSELRHLENLVVYDKYKPSPPTKDEKVFVLDCMNLKQLNLTIYMPRLPDRQHFPSYLTSISLTGCRLEEDPMPILEKLLQLKNVQLLSESFSGKRMVCSWGGFPQLQMLSFGLDEWEEWIIEEGSMPLLHNLVFIGCQKLKELPDGLRFITSLKSLVCHVMGIEWAERLSKEGEDYYKVQHIPHVKC
ncbi:hypothetical protein EUTSA_v10023259mg [Eutrema salsugineum]|uniref:NB-ARC domain-containing protein n=1 Tax=Eutrema salsugineum TaxID=72664 RepID=V4ME49_EUTSA|nr:hypothetical protein EUTSA_v10023259mg [Eutrema salsugineum]